MTSNQTQPTDPRDLIARAVARTVRVGSIPEAVAAADAVLAALNAAGKAVVDAPELEWGVRFDGEDVLPLSEGSARRQAGAAGDGQPRLVRRRVGEWEAAP